MRVVFKHFTLTKKSENLYVRIDHIKHLPSSLKNYTLDNIHIVLTSKNGIEILYDLYGVNFPELWKNIEHNITATYQSEQQMVKYADRVISLANHDNIYVKIPLSCIDKKSLQLYQEIVKRL